MPILETDYLSSLKPVFLSCILWNSWYAALSIYFIKLNGYNNFRWIYNWLFCTPIIIYVGFHIHSFYYFLVLKYNYTPWSLPHPHPNSSFIQFSLSNWWLLLFYIYIYMHEYMCYMSVFIHIHACISLVLLNVPSEYMISWLSILYQIY